ncbi:MAG: SMI1/KNR4 family protein [Luteolibacter sp.]
MNLIDFAKEHDAELFPPMGGEQIAAFETERGLILPEELREFYLKANGTKEFTDWIWRIWKFDEFLLILERHWDDGLLPDTLSESSSSR